MNRPWKRGRGSRPATMQDHNLLVEIIHEAISRGYDQGYLDGLVAVEAGSPQQPDLSYPRPEVSES